LRRGEGTGYIGIRRLQVRLLSAARAAVAQWIEQRTNTWAADSRRKSCRDGEEKSYFICQTTWGCGPATLIDYSSRLDVGRREPRTSRRFAPGLEETPSWVAALKEMLARMFCAQTRKVGRGEGSGLLGLTRGRCGVRFPPGSKDPVAHWSERLMSLAGCSRPAD